MKSSANTALDRAVEVRDVVRSLRHGYGLTQSTIARATGTSPRSVRNWEITSSIRETNDDRLRELREIVLLLSETLTARGVGQWLRARNRLLKGHRPIDLLANGKIKSVRNAAKAYVEGAYV